MTAPEAVEAVRDGLAEGGAACRARGHEIEVRQLVTAMRQAEPTRDIAELALSYRHDGVAGFDIAGPEHGYPPSRFLESFQLLRRKALTTPFMPVKLVAVEYIWEAVQVCGANRIGHGVAIIEDIQRMSPAGPRWGLRGVPSQRADPAEMCLSSNVQTGTAASIAEHPIHHLDRLGFRVTVNPDNRLMSATTLTGEFACSPRHSTTA